MTLQALLADHTAMYRADVTFDRLVQQQPPMTVDPHTGARHEEPATAIGMNMSQALQRLLGHPEGYGMAHPWLKALWRLKVECRRSHPYHRGPTVPYWRGSLCHQLVTFTVINGWSVENAAKILRYDNPEPILRNAFRYIEATIDAERGKAERRAREDAGTGPGPIPQPVIVHHAVPGLHRQECPQCRRGVVA